MWEYTTVIKNEFTGKTSQLGVDQAFANITTNVKPSIWMYTLSEDCILVMCIFVFTIT